MKKEAVSGAVIVEFALTVGLVLTIIGFVWTFLSIEDFKQSIYSAAYAAFNNKQSRFFSRDSLGNTIRWDNATVGTGILDAVRTEFQSRVVAGSAYTAFSPTVLCEVRLGYLDLSSGRVASSAPTVTPPTTGYSGDQALVMGMIDSAVSDYHTKMNGRFLLPAEALLQTNPEYQAGYIDSGTAIDPTTAPSPTSIYFPWSPFYAWGCLIKRRVLMFDLNEDFSGIFVPNKTLL